MPPARLVIVNADDFGQSPGVNRGIIVAHEGGIVTSTSLMVRWPAAGAAAQYARAHPILSVGLHFDLGEWTLRDGEWVPVYQVTLTDDAAAVSSEVARQLSDFRRLVGRNPTHLDSHQHVHTREPARALLADLGQQLGVPVRHLTAGLNYCGEFYGQDENGQPHADWVSGDALAGVLARRLPGLTELACHPAEVADLETMYRDERALELAALCDPRVRTAAGQLGIEFVSFLDAQARGMGVKTLVAGWFSFELMGASAGDLMARDVACEWLRDAGRVNDIALAPPFTGGVDWRAVDPAAYDQVVFVCGPFGNGPPLTEFLARFAGRWLVGLNLTMLDSLDNWNPFDLLIERDSSARTHPDMALASRLPHVPVVGVVLIDTQPEYRHRDLHEAANAAILRLAAGHDVATVRIDTRLDANTTGLSSAAQIESLIARMDAVLTTRLHGMVLALKNGVPALALDPVAGGAKIRRQAEALGWPVAFTADAVTDGQLAETFNYCLTADARATARTCSERARTVLRQTRTEFLAKLAQWEQPEP